MLTVEGMLLRNRTSVGFHQSSRVNHGPTSRTGAPAHEPLTGFVTRTQHVSPHSVRTPHRSCGVPARNHGHDDEVQAGSETKRSLGTMTWPLAVVPPTSPSRVPVTR